MGAWIDRRLRLLCAAELASTEEAFSARLAELSWTPSAAGSGQDGLAHGRCFDVGIRGGLFSVIEVDAKEDGWARVIDSIAGDLSKALRCRTAIVDEGRWGHSYVEIEDGRETMVWSENGAFEQLLRHDADGAPRLQDWLEATKSAHADANEGFILVPEFLEQLLAARFGPTPKFRASEGFGETAVRWGTKVVRYTHALVSPLDHELSRTFDAIYARVTRGEEVVIRGFGTFSLVRSRLHFRLAPAAREALRTRTHFGLSDRAADAALHALISTDADVALGEHMILYTVVKPPVRGMNPATSEPIDRPGSIGAGVAVRRTLEEDRHVED